MPATRVVSEPCYCCEGDDCCAFTSDIPFTVPSGFTLESKYCSNANSYGCVGRQDCEIKISKPANPGMSCDSVCKHSSRCNVSSIPASVTSAFWSHLIGYLSNYVANTPGTPSLFACASPCSPPSPLTSACCFDLLYPDVYSAYTCNCQSSSYSAREGLFKRTSIGLTNLGCINPNTYCMNNLWSVEIGAIHAALSGSPLIITTQPATGYTCEWWLWGASSTRNMQATNNVCYHSHYTTCSYIDEICEHHVEWIQVHCAVRCNQNPCSGVTGPSWDMTLPCTCDSEYSPPDPSSKPACTLYMYDSSGPEYENDKCIWTANYGGRLTAGEVDCDSSPTDPDCVCCDEGGGS